MPAAKQAFFMLERFHAVAVLVLCTTIDITDSIELLRYRVWANVRSVLRERIANISLRPSCSEPTASRWSGSGSLAIASAACFPVTESV